MRGSPQPQPCGPQPRELSALGFSSSVSPRGEERGWRADRPGSVWQEAGGALDRVLGPPKPVPCLKHLAEAAAGHPAPVALEVILGEEGEAAQTLLHAHGHGDARPATPPGLAHGRSGRSFLTLRSGRLRMGRRAGPPSFRPRRSRAWAARAGCGKPKPEP